MVGKFHHRTKPVAGGDEQGAAVVRPRHVRQIGAVLVANDGQHVGVLRVVQHDRVGAQHGQNHAVRQLHQRRRRHRRGGRGTGRGTGRSTGLAACGGRRTQFKQDGVATDTDGRHGLANGEMGHWTLPLVAGKHVGGVLILVSGVGFELARWCHQQRTVHRPRRATKKSRGTDVVQIQRV